MWSMPANVPNASFQMLLQWVTCQMLLILMPLLQPSSCARIELDCWLMRPRRRPPCGTPLASHYQDFPLHLAGPQPRNW